MKSEAYPMNTETYSRKSLWSTIKNGALALGTYVGVTLAGSLARAQDEPKPEAPKAEATIENKVEEFKLPFRPSHIFLPQRLDSTYVGGGFRSGDSDSSGTILEGNLRLEDFAQAPGGLYLLTETRKRRADTVAPEDAELFTTDIDSTGTSSVKRDAKSSYTLIGGGAYGAILQFNAAKERASKLYDIDEVLMDDPSLPLTQTSQRDLDADNDLSVKAVRAGYTLEPVSVMVGGFKRKSSSRESTSFVGTLSGIFNFQSTETRDTRDEADLKGYLAALEVEVLPYLKLGAEGWIASGDRKFSEAYFSDVTAPPVIDTFTEGSEDIGYKQFALSARGSYGVFVGSLQAGKRKNDGSIDDQTFYSAVAGVRLGAFLLNGVVGKDALAGNTFFGGNAAIGSYTLEDLAELNALSNEVIGMTFNGDPTYTDTQSAASRLRHIERIARKPGFVLGAYGWKDPSDTKVILPDIAANFGYGVVFQVTGALNNSDDSGAGTAYLHWNLADLGLPLMVSGFYDYAKTKGEDAETGVGGLLVFDGGMLYRLVTGK